MVNINRKSRANFRWVLSCSTIGLLVSIPTMLRAADLGTQGMQRLGTVPPETMPFRCDSLDPKVCFDIYQRKLEKAQEAPNWGSAPNLTTKFEYSTATGFITRTSLSIPIPWTAQTLRDELGLGTPIRFGTVPSLPVPAFCWDPGSTCDEFSRRADQKAFKFR
jgi:hypothetical protein